VAAVGIRRVVVVPGLVGPVAVALVMSLVLLIQAAAAALEHILIHGKVRLAALVS
jgi:hypothetical protein